MAFEGFRTCVLSEMTGELIRSRKLPTARFPRAFIRFLTGMGSLVGFQMRAFCVNFITTGMITFVCFSPFYICAYSGIATCLFYS